MTHTYCAFGKCSTCSMLHSLHKCEISSKFSNLLHFTNKITHLRIHRTENAMRNYYNYAFSRTTRGSLKPFLTNILAQEFVKQLQGLQVLNG